MNDPIDSLTDLTPPVTPDVEALRRARGNLMTELSQDTVPPTSIGAVRSPRRHRRRWVIPVAAVSVAAFATAATWAITLNGNSQDTTNVECQSDQGGQSWSIVRAQTGDPVADCQAEWKRMNESAAPPMVAYDNGRGGVRVQLADKPAPKNATKLKPGDYQKPGLIKFQAFIDDIGYGLASKCYSDAGAQAALQAQMKTLGLSGWKIDSDPKRVADGSTLCADAAIGPEAGTVTLFGSRGAPFGTGPDGQFARRIEDTLDAKCQDIDSATATVRTMAAETQGQSFDVSGPNMVMIPLAPDSSQLCTSATVEVGGAFIVTLRGPAK